MNKSEELDKIAKEIENCKKCKVNKIGRAVPGEGSPNANVVFVGEAPGKTESKTGRPFVGRSGKFLRDTIKSIGFREEDVYITSPVKYLPKYGTPKPSDIEHGKTHFDKQIEIIDPKLIVMMGSVACQAVLGEKVPIVSEHGKIMSKNNRSYLITFHPAAVIRFPSKFKNEFINDFKKIANLIKNTK